MKIFDLFSKRQKRLRGEVPDVYVYDALPNPLRVQIVHIIKDAFGVDNYGSNHAEKAYAFVNDALCREYGVFELIKHSDSPQGSVFNFFLKEESVERAIDVIEVCFKVIDTYIRDEYRYQNNTKREVQPDAAIEELNTRFKEHGVGYQFEANEIIRVDSRPLDGRVRPHASHDPELHSALGGVVSKKTHLTSTCCAAAGACTACIALPGARVRGPGLKLLKQQSEPHFLPCGSTTCGLVGADHLRLALGLQLPVLASECLRFDHLVRR
ncbi:STM4504/CBY_0614 family protein [Piscinibacter gummiphilus]|uniref:HEPN AbiJ-N-terminal domain-containing protein n=1 Tax=Piscinibacter gummiphilus TaxID=946333 RepID=A0ABZ0CPP7_9BURK|nr:hypothetical protein [Piscinibacter gummiphilus]WOB06952.1 hypothetical protein RXV79_18740 [Piscinibacter gummiphilus]